LPQIRPPHPKIGVGPPHHLNEGKIGADIEIELRPNTFYPLPMAYKRKDYYYRRAKTEGKVSRATYKLSEIQRRFRITKKGDVVIDLGCAPGGWLIELSEFVGPQGKVIGIDILPVKTQLPKQCLVIQGDLREEFSLGMLKQAAGRKVDAILSDMSPDISGIEFADTYHSYELALLALDTCRQLLKPGGNFLVKLFPGDEFADFVKTLKLNFQRVSTIVPKATRKTSSERYLVALGYKKSSTARE
jgi:23S rRNA (uridine2552-2'-O)-methyltransferase